MGTAANKLIEGITIEEASQDLRKLYSTEMTAMQWLMSVGNQLEGAALFLLEAQLNLHADASLARAKKLAARMGQLGEEIPFNTSDVSIIQPTMPESFADVGSILQHVLGYEGILLTAYHTLIQKTASKDVITSDLALQIFAEHVATEDEIEAAMVQGA